MQVVSSNLASVDDFHSIRAHLGRTPPGTQEAWQTLLTTAFREHRADLLRIVRTHQPELKVDRELAREEVTYLLNARPKDWKSNLAEIITVSNLADITDIIVVAVSDALGCFENPGESGDLLEAFVQAGIKPAPSEVRQAYWRVKAQGTLEDTDSRLEKLFEITGLMPEHSFLSLLIRERPYLSQHYAHKLCGLSLRTPTQIAHWVQSIFRADRDSPEIRSDVVHEAPKKQAPLTAREVSGLYQKWSEGNDFGVIEKFHETGKLRGTQKVLDLFTRTGIVPEFDLRTRVIGRIYYSREVLNGKERCPKFEELLGLPAGLSRDEFIALAKLPSPLDFGGTSKVLSSELASEGFTQLFEQLVSWKPPNDQIIHLIEWLDNALKKFNYVPTLDADRIEKVVTNLAQARIWSAGKLCILLRVIERFMPPTPRMVDIVLAEALPRSLHSEVYKNGDGAHRDLIQRWNIPVWNRQYTTGWEWLTKTYGPASETAIQNAYVAALKYIRDGNRGDIQELSIIARESGTPPNIDEIERIASENKLVNPGTSYLDTVFKSILINRLCSRYDIKNFETYIGKQFGILPGNADVLSAQILHEYVTNLKSLDDIHLYGENLRDRLTIVANRSGQPLNPDLAQVFYVRLISNTRFGYELPYFERILGAPLSFESLMSSKISLLEQAPRKPFKGHTEYEYFDLIADQQGFLPFFPTTEAARLYENCAALGPGKYEHLPTLISKTGVRPSQEFVRHFVLANSSFQVTIEADYSWEDLDPHFSKPKNCNAFEFERLCRVLGCSAYLTARLENVAALESREDVGIIGALACAAFAGDGNEYTALKARLLKYTENPSFLLLEDLSIALSNLIQKGDTELEAHYYQPGQALKASSEKCAPGAYSPSITDRLLIRTLSKIDTPPVNLLLLDLALVSGLPRGMRRGLLINLLVSKPNFFSDQIAPWAFNRFNGGDEAWADLKYYAAILRISNSDTRILCKENLGTQAQALCDRLGCTLRALHGKMGGHIELDAFFAWLCFTDCDESLLRKVDALYARSRSNTARANLLTSLITALSSRQETTEVIRSMLNSVPFTGKEAMQHLALVFRRVTFFERVAKALDHNARSSSVNRSTTHHLTFFTKETLAEVSQALEDAALEEIVKVLNHRSITSDSLKALWLDWGELDPIFVLAGKLLERHDQDTLNYIAELVSHMDPPDYKGWKKWRYYDSQGQVVPELSHLSKKQLEMLTCDHVIAIDPALITSASLEKNAGRAERVYEILVGAVSAGHISRPADNFFPEFYPIQQELEQLLLRSNMDFNNRTRNLAQVVERLDQELDHLSLSFDINDVSSSKEANESMKRHQALRALRDICLLAAVEDEDYLNGKFKAQNSVSGRSIDEILGSLKIYFRSNPTFLQDLKNISYNSSHNGVGLVPNHRYALLHTDHPGMLFRIGRFPLGSFSCMNYEGADIYAVALPAYPGGPNIWGEFLIDLSKLNSVTSDLLMQGGINAVASAGKMIELLEAVVARQILKTGPTNGEHQVLFQEDVYPGKLDVFEKIFDTVLQEKLAEPVELYLTRGLGDLQINFPAPNNPGGVYEDWSDSVLTALGGIKHEAYQIRAKLVDGKVE